jgi:hypothetical protein
MVGRLFLIGGLMQASFLARVCLLVVPMFTTPGIFANGWFSDLMVRVPTVGYYFMDSDQKQIYTYQQNLSELRRLSHDPFSARTYKRFGFTFHRPFVVFGEEIAKRCGDKITTGSFDEQKILIGQRIHDIYAILDSTDKNRNAHGSSDRILTPEQVSVIDECIKNNKSNSAFVGLAEALSLNHAINDFRKTDQYKKSVVHSKPIKSAIDLRESTLHGIENPFYKLGMEEEFKSKEFPQQLKSQSAKYHADILRAYKFDKKQAIDHLKQNINSLKKLYSESQHKVDTYKAIDE